MIWDISQIQNALLGGALIGLSASLMLLLNGQITGISGIFASLLPFDSRNLWKVFFIAGLLLGGFSLQAFYPSRLDSTLNFDLIRIVAAGLLVGFGTRLGSGCTSGHGVCGVSRLSPRSIVATLTFIISGVVTVYLFGAS